MPTKTLQASTTATQIWAPFAVATTSMSGMPENQIRPTLSHQGADANATLHEIGDDSRYFLDQFVFEPPKLGSIKDLFDKYKGEIEDLD